MTLTEFLQEKAKDETARERSRLREEWVGTVNRLIAQFQAWLREADRLGVLVMWTEEIEILEERLGAYRVPRLHIRLNGTDVKVVPVARSIGGRITKGEGKGERMEGRIDILGVGMRYILYRVLENEEQWYALDEKFESKLFDRDRFEAIMKEMLS